MRWSIRNLLKDVVFQTPFARFICFRYRFNFLPAQLAFLLDCLDKTANVPGVVMEIGCFEGATTVYLKKHMAYKEIDKPYFAIDTFAGFLEPHINYEVRQRGKTEESLKRGFASNKKKWFEKTMKINKIEQVNCIEADATTVDYNNLGCISLALIDLDLYLPVKEVLGRVWPLLSSQGIIIVDDCVQGQRYDGALEAYNEFMQSQGMSPLILHDKLGFIRKE
jgi:hypothetical protein